MKAKCENGCCYLFDEDEDVVIEEKETETEETHKEDNEEK